MKVSSISSVESQKGIIADQRCSIENQKGAIAILCTAIAPFWFSSEHLWNWSAITPFWLSTDDIIAYNTTIKDHEKEKDRQHMDIWPKKIILWNRNRRNSKGKKLKGNICTQKI